MATDRTQVAIVEFRQGPILENEALATTDLSSAENMESVELDLTAFAIQSSPVVASTTTPPPSKPTSSLAAMAQADGRENVSPESSILPDLPGLRRRRPRRSDGSLIPAPSQTPSNSAWSQAVPPSAGSPSNQQLSRAPFPPISGSLAPTTSTQQSAASRSRQTVFVTITKCAAPSFAPQSAATAKGIPIGDISNGISGLAQLASSNSMSESDGVSVLPSDVAQSMDGDFDGSVGVEGQHNPTLASPQPTGLPGLSHEASDDSGSGSATTLSPGQIAGITVGSLLGLAIVLGSFFLWRRRRRMIREVPHFTFASPRKQRFIERLREGMSSRSSHRSQGSGQRSSIAGSFLSESQYSKSYGANSRRHTRAASQEVFLPSAAAIPPLQASLSMVEEVEPSWSGSQPISRQASQRSYKSTVSDGASDAFRSSTRGSLQPEWLARDLHRESDYNYYQNYGFGGAESLKVAWPGAQLDRSPSLNTINR